MTDPIKTGGGKRIRGPIFGKRLTVSVRMEPELHEKMMDLCDVLSTPANAYIIKLIQKDLLARKIKV